MDQEPFQVIGIQPVQETNLANYNRYAYVNSHQAVLLQGTHHSPPPLHYREQVHRDLEADMKKGVRCGFQKGNPNLGASAWLFSPQKVERREEP